MASSPLSCESDAAFSKCGRTVRQDPFALAEELHMATVMAEALFTKFENTHQLNPAALFAHKAMSLASAHAASPRYEIVVPSDPAAARETRARALAEAAFSKFVNLVQLQPPAAFPKPEPQPDPAAAATARAQWEDIIQGLEKRIVIVHCSDCERYLMEDDVRRWIAAEDRSTVLLALCGKRFKLKNKLDGVYIGRPAFTNDSREFGVAFPLLKVSSGIVLKHTHIVDFDVHYQFCERCSSKYEQLSCSSDDNLKSEPLDYPPFPPLLPLPSLLT